MEAIYLAIITLHALSATIAVGAVTVTDYLHIVGLRKKKLEKKLSEVYPSLTNIITYALIFLFISGFIMVYLNQSLLKSPFFLTKAVLIILVSVNGIFLHRKVEPKLEVCVINGTKHCSTKLLYSSAIFGSFSIVTWYAIIVLSMTKTYGYQLSHFLITYTLILFIAMITAYFTERNARIWK